MEAVVKTKVEEIKLIKSDLRKLDWRDLIKLYSRWSGKHTYCRMLEPSEVKVSKFNEAVLKGELHRKFTEPDEI